MFMTMKRYFISLKVFSCKCGTHIQNKTIRILVKGFRCSVFVLFCFLYFLVKCKTDFTGISLSFLSFRPCTFSIIFVTS